MKNHLTIFVALLSFTAITSCTSQNKTEQAKDNIKVVKEIIPPEDFDPYFTESSAVQTSYGPTSITRNILQDKRGDIWFATWTGVIKHSIPAMPLTEAKPFTNLTNKEGLRRHRFFSLLEDKAGIIWFGTIGAGVYRYDPATEDFYNFPMEKGLVNDDVGCIFQDSKGHIWFGTRLGISRYSFDGKDIATERSDADVSFTNFTSEDGLPDLDINSFAEANDGRIWIGARGEASIYDGTSKEGFTKILNNEGKSFYNVRSIIKDRNGNMWLGGNDGLWFYNGETFSMASPHFTGYIFEDKDGSIWTSQSDPQDMYRMALYRYDEATVTSGGKSVLSKSSRLVKVADPEGQVFGITQDKDGFIWYGHGRGACRYNPDMPSSDEGAFECFTEEG